MFWQGVFVPGDFACPLRLRFDEVSVITIATTVGELELSVGGIPGEVPCLEESEREEDCQFENTFVKLQQGF